MADKRDAGTRYFGACSIGDYAANGSGMARGGKNDEENRCDCMAQHTAGNCGPEIEALHDGSFVPLGTLKRLRTP
jgi:hypothetical protein